MPAQIDHPCFQPPANPNIPIWRYMDFTKYVWLLQNKSLFFCRADKCEDPYEGATSLANVALGPTLYGDGDGAATFLKKRSETNERTRQWTFINSWHMNEHESAAMWKLYARNEEAVAIQSTYFKLQTALPEYCLLGVVNYRDYQKDALPDGNAFWGYAHKRKSFEHECELRAVIRDLPRDISQVNNEGGTVVPVELQSLIVRVYISPTAPMWFADLVRAITLKYGYPLDIQQSILSRDPIF